MHKTEKQHKAVIITCYPCSALQCLCVPVPSRLPPKAKSTQRVSPELCPGAQALHDSFSRNPHGRFWIAFSKHVLIIDYWNPSLLNLNHFVRISSSLLSRAWPWEVGGSGRSPAGSAATQLEARQVRTHNRRHCFNQKVFDHLRSWLYHDFSVCIFHRFEDSGRAGQPAHQAVWASATKVSRWVEFSTKMYKVLWEFAESLAFSVPIDNCKSCVPRWFRVSCLQIECTECLGICSNKNGVFSCFRKCWGEFWEHRGCWFGGTLAGKDYHHFPTTISEVAAPQVRLVFLGGDAGDAYFRVQADFRCIIQLS